MLGRLTASQHGPESTLSFFLIVLLARFDIERHPDRRHQPNLCPSTAISRRQQCAGARASKPTTHRGSLAKNFDD
jgi:hypothetical protein